MKNKTPYLLCASLLICFPTLTFAQVVITEIMYDLKNGADGGREWVEVYNAGASSVSLSTFRLFENGTAHKIIPATGDGLLPARSYVVIADNATNFKTDWPQYSGPLFDSTFSLSNSGETIVLRNASSTDVDIAAYTSAMGAAGDGNSLNRAEDSGSAFVPRAPSPGGAMSAEAIAPPKALAKAVPAKSVPSEKRARPVAVASKAQVAAAGASEVVVPDASDRGVSSTPLGDSPTNSSVWILGAIVIAAFASSALLLARRLSKTEWDIEEIEE